MPPKTKATPEQVEQEFIEHSKRVGRKYTPYDKSFLAKKKSSGSNRDLSRRTHHG